METTPSLPALQAFAGQELEWVKPKRPKNHYVLQASDGQIVATLDRGKKSATGATATGNYTLQRQGFWRQRIVVESAQDHAQAVFAGKTLTVPSGETITCEKVRMLSSERVWKDASGAPLLSVRPSNWKATAKVVIEPAGATLPELSLLVLLAQFRVVLAREDEEAAVAASVVSTAAVH
jgi:hypothetical protein